MTELFSLSCTAGANFNAVSSWPRLGMIMVMITGIVHIGYVLLEELLAVSVLVDFLKKVNYNETYRQAETQKKQLQTSYSASIFPGKALCRALINET